MIQLKSISYSYPKTDFSLKIESIKIDSSEKIGLIGESGCGKSTLLKIFSGEILPLSGEAQIDGEKLIDMSENERRQFRLENIGLVLQDSAMLEYLNLKDNILIPTTVLRQKVDDDHLLKLAETCGIAKLFNKKPSAISAGERQRAAVCRALITSPKIILADEPTSSLDAKNGRIVTDLLTEYCEKESATLVMITHDQNQHEKFDRVIDLEEINEAKND